MFGDVPFAGDVDTIGTNGSLIAVDPRSSLVRKRRHAPVPDHPDVELTAEVAEADRS
jgi:hypothetical protein